MTNAINLDDLSKEELEQIAKEAQARLTKMRDKHIDDLCSEIVKAADEFGYDVSEIISRIRKKKTPKKKKASATPDTIYRNPENASETWTGHGRRPKWVVAFQENGGDMEAIKEAA